jgi:uncharacterized protein
LYVQDGGLVTGRSVSPAGYGRFLIDVFEDWVRRDVGEVYVQMFDVALANWYGEPPGLCVHSETCGLALALEHTGDLYSCDHFVEPRYKLGNIRDKKMLDLIALPEQATFGMAKRDGLPNFCRECDVRFACHGGCPKDRFIMAPDGEAGLNYLCPGYKAFFGHVRPAMELMCGLLRAGLAPSLISGQYARADAAAAPPGPPCALRPSEECRRWLNSGCSRTATAMACCRYPAAPSPTACARSCWCRAFSSSCVAGLRSNTTCLTVPVKA